MSMTIRRATAAAVVVIGGGISCAALAASDAELQAAYEHGYQSAIAHAKYEQAQAAAAPAAAQPVAAPAPRQARTMLVDMKETYSDAGDSEKIQYMPDGNGGPQRPVVNVMSVQPAPPSQAVVQLVPNPQEAAGPDQDSPDQNAADVQSLKKAIQRLDAWVAKLPHGAPNQVAADEADDTPAAAVAAPAVIATARPVQYVNVAPRMPAPMQAYSAPPPPWVSQNQPEPSGGRQMVWSNEFQHWVYMAR